MSIANYIDPQIAEAVVAVLHHNGIDVYVPAGQGGCGMAALAYGDVETAREAAEHNLRVLAEAAREGYPIVCSEPTAALMLTPRLPRFAGRSRRQAGGRRRRSNSPHIFGICTSKAACAPIFSQLDLGVGHHVPCHVKALNHAVPARSGPACR